MNSKQTHITKKARKNKFIPMFDFNMNELVSLKNSNEIIALEHEFTSNKLRKIVTRNNGDTVRIGTNSFISIHGSRTDTSATILPEIENIEKEIKFRLNQSELQRTREAIKFKNDNNLSKNNSIPTTDLNKISFPNKMHITIIDEVLESINEGDKQIANKVFKMLSNCVLLHPTAKILINPLEDSRLCISDLIDDELISKISGLSSKLYFIQTPMNDMQLIKQSDLICTINSPLGFDALLLKKKVECYSKTFYSHIINFSNDVKQERELTETLFYDIYIRNSRYINPCTNENCELEDILELSKLNSKYDPLINIQVEVAGKNLRNKSLKLVEKLSIAQATRSNNLLANLVKSTRGSDVTIEESLLQVNNIRDFGRINSGIIRQTNNAKLMNFNQWMKQSTINTVISERDTKKAPHILRDYTRLNLLDKPRFTKNNRRILLAPYVMVVDDALEDINDTNNHSYESSIKIAQERYPYHLIVMVSNKASKNKHKQVHTIIDGRDLTHWLEGADCLITINSRIGLEGIIRGIPVYCIGNPFYYGHGLTIDEICIDKEAIKIDSVDFFFITMSSICKYYDKSSDLQCRLEDSLKLLSSKKSRIHKSMTYRFYNYINNQIEKISTLVEHAKTLLWG